MAFLTVNLNTRSLSMHATNVSVILPETNDVPEHGWKTLMLLHGAGGSNLEWVRYSSIERYAEKRGIAVIMPEGGLSFYNDMTYGEDYKTFITEDLRAFCAAHFNTSVRREDNVIGGLSMGGVGSMTIGLARPDLYKSLICLSASNFPVEVFPKQFKNPPWPNWVKMMRAIYGDTLPNFEGTKFDFYQLAKDALAQGKELPSIFHSIGEQESEDSLNSAYAMRDFFMGFEGNPFRYKFVSYPGIHNWDFWDAHIEEALDYAGFTPIQ
ncbi:MAG: alpha/beta hydrolase-fold protein [Lachnospiraceae bacterium]|nr:alpha/beta hydrolase-fold protein [Lachnospiraceae bacterium]